ncbi:hypothetical protein Ddye_003915 [Dipteronia dyeriana]|uniref:NmrA-like domain-containing protein n=1 Tax=Dipteronia dyeriana TaxID=168575 RepID=A0AAD9XT61_9ROSI|nr:hypothetical protein Ddye_003915 [Dipteronia dyeriana]
MALKSRILFIGGTGYIGKYIVKASVLAGHPTFVLVRESTLSSASKEQVMETFKSLNVNFIIRFFPSEFANDVDHVHTVEPAKTLFATKAKIRRVVEAEGIPYTYVTSNFFSGYFLPTISQIGASAPPTDTVIILGDGNPKGKDRVFIET